MTRKVLCAALAMSLAFFASPSSATTKLATNFNAANASNTNANNALSVLDTKPNQLHNIEGLHQGKVPLNTISPVTLKTFVQTVDLIRREYVDVVDDDLLIYHALNGMLNRVDKHAQFLDTAALANLQSFTQGNVAGVGLKANWQAGEGHWVVSEVTANSPAALAGITRGDYLHQIGEVRLNASLSKNDVTQLLNGISGTNVDVTFSKQGRSKKSANLLRDQLQQTQIEVLNYNGVIVVKLPVFQNNTREVILQRISALNTPIQGVVIDVRNNPGGVLDAAVDVASLFMRKQTVTQVQNRNGVERVYETQGSPIFEALPLIILQNRYSASASEVLSSALQTQGRALVVGERSYGKGSIQSVISLNNNQGVSLTTAHYLTPKGVKIDGVGVTPDVNFDKPNNELTDSWLDQSLNLMEQAKLKQEDAVEFSPVGGF